jgi:uncharacterized protein YbaR (Trm112 family)
MIIKQQELDKLVLKLNELPKLRGEIETINIETREKSIKTLSQQSGDLIIERVCSEFGTIIFKDKKIFPERIYFKKGDLDNSTTLYEALFKFFNESRMEVISEEIFLEDLTEGLTNPDDKNTTINTDSINAKIISKIEEDYSYRHYFLGKYLKTGDKEALNKVKEGISISSQLENIFKDLEDVIKSSETTEEQDDSFYINEKKKSYKGVSIKRFIELVNQENPNPVETDKKHCCPERKGDLYHGNDGKWYRIINKENLPEMLSRKLGKIKPVKEGL